MLNKETATKQELAYYQYIVDHVKTVKYVWSEVQKVANGSTWLADDFRWATINALIMQHDQSKFGVEFDAYRRKFFPEPGETQNPGYFDHAWNNHQKENKHHWQYWVLYKHGGSKALYMPFEYTVEMLCDWTAMSIAFKNSPAKWFEENRGSMLLQADTLNTILNMLPDFEKVYDKSVGEGLQG